MKKQKTVIALLMTFSLILLAFGMFLFYKDYQKKHKEEEITGFNTTCPDGKETEFEETKSQAYENAVDSAAKVTLATLGEVDSIKKNTVVTTATTAAPPPIKKIVKTSPIKDTDTIRTKPVASKRGFISIVPTLQKEIKAISACIHHDQKVQDGGRVIIRTQEKFECSGFEIDKGTIITGIAKFSGDRIIINVTSIKSGRNIIPAKLSVYDNDAQEGIYFPELIEEKSAKSTSNSLTRKAAESISSSGLVGSLVSGGVDYITKRSSSRSVKLNSDYKIYLMQL